MIRFSGDIRRDFDKATAEISKLKDRILGYQEKISNLRETEKRLRKANASQKEKYEEALTEKDAVIKELQNRLAHAEALLNHDSTNTGTPTGQTPPNKNKVIPNSRRSSGKPKGGQKGHEKHPFRNRMKMMLPTTLSIPSRMMSAAQNAALLNALLLENLRSNMNTMYVSKS